MDASRMLMGLKSILIWRNMHIIGRRAWSKKHVAAARATKSHRQRSPRLGRLFNYTVDSRRQEPRTLVNFEKHAPRVLIAEEGGQGRLLPGLTPGAHFQVMQANRGR